MADGKLPPIIDIVIAGWRDGLRALAVMPMIGLIAYLAMISLGLVEGILWKLFPEPKNLSLGLLFLEIALSDVIYGFVIAPLAIAVHRFVLLGEVAKGYSLDPSNRRYLRFAVCSVLILLAYKAPMVGMFITASGLLPIEASLLVFVAIVILLFLAIFRLLILFPAIAIDAPGAHWRNADKDTEGHTVYVAMVVICTTLPATLVRIYLKNLGGQGAKSSSIALTMFDSITAVPLTCVYVAVASHLFLALAYQLRWPPGSVPPAS